MLCLIMMILLQLSHQLTRYIFWSDTVKGLTEIFRVLKSRGSFYNVVYTTKFLDKLAYTKKGFKKFAPKQLVELEKQMGFEKNHVKHIEKEKSFVVVCTKH